MKHKQFKITNATLFVYLPKRTSKPGHETDPTTSMMTMTVTGIHLPGVR